jgi:hypothetical protein
MIGNAGPTCIVQETGDCHDDPDEAFHFRAFRDAAHVPATPYHSLPSSHEEAKKKAGGDFGDELRKHQEAEG